MLFLTEYDWCCRCLCGAGGRKSSQRSNQTRRGSDGSQLGVRAPITHHSMHARAHSGSSTLGLAGGLAGSPCGAGLGTDVIGGAGLGGVQPGLDLHLPHCAQHPANASRTYGLLGGDDSDVNNGSDSR